MEENFNFNINPSVDPSIATTLENDHKEILLSREMIIESNKSSLLKQPENQNIYESPEPQDVNGKIDI